MRHNRNRARELRTQGLAIIQLAGLQKFMIAFMILALMSLPFVQPIQKKVVEEKKEAVKSAGDMMIEIHWPDKLDIDIDLWAKSPDDERPVGYSNRAGKTFNLLRDDRGKKDDTTERNFEMFYARGLPAGEYIVNVHYFLSHEREQTPEEIPVDIIISTKAVDPFGGPDHMKQILVRKVVLRTSGEETTVVRFVIKEDGELDKDSINDFYEELRTWQPPTQ